MATLRPTSPASGPALSGGDAYYAIYQAVRTQQGLIHGRFDDARGAHCALGSYFAIDHHLALPHAMIDEVAAINDCVPTRTPRQRRLIVLRWLRWKLSQHGFAMPTKAQRVKGYLRAGQTVSGYTRRPPKQLGPATAA